MFPLFLCDLAFLHTIVLKKATGQKNIICHWIGKIDPLWENPLAF
jgi:hypothetical protein